MDRRHILIAIYLVANVFGSDVESPEEQQGKNRAAKILPIFQVVKFPNDLCTGTSYNGTCYTAEECSSKGGTKDGTCASGFGVCCYFLLSCNSTSSENNTYLFQSSSSSIQSPCNYKICPCSTNICRIRYDFTTFTLASPEGITALNTAAVPAADYTQCLIDAFSISAPNAVGSPVICGANSGYHMILDSDGTNCQNANFLIGTSTTTTRAWNIRVTQYACGQEDSSGPPGCLQYYTQTQNYVQTFNFPTSHTGSTTTATVAYTHLANQHYDICIRRASGYCYICYTAQTPTPAADNTFSLSIGPAAATTNVDSACISDYVEIPLGTTAAIAAKTDPVEYAAETYVNRICGKFFSYITADANSLTVCSKSTPFRLGVHLDSLEVTNGGAAITSEVHSSPSGSIGFKLFYFQKTC